MNLSETAARRFKEGYSCSQSVFSALAERWRVDPAVSLRVAAGFGGGMGRSAGTCGCVTGAIMAIGLAQGSVTPEENRAEKEKTYELVREFMRRFEADWGSTVCSDFCRRSTSKRQTKKFANFHKNFTWKSIPNKKSKTSTFPSSNGWKS